MVELIIYARHKSKPPYLCVNGYTPATSNKKLYSNYATALTIIYGFYAKHKIFNVSSFFFILSSFLFETHQKNGWSFYFFSLDNFHCKEKFRLDKAIVTSLIKSILCRSKKNNCSLDLELLTKDRTFWPKITSGYCLMIMKWKKLQT